MSTPSYHDLHITTEQIERTSIFNLPYGLEVNCTRVSGWQLWDHNQTPDFVPGSAVQPKGPKLIAGEYDKPGLRLDVAGHVIVDSLIPATPEEIIDEPHHD